MGGVSMMPAICVCTALNGREERGCAGLGRPPGRPAAAAQTTRRDPRRRSARLSGSHARRRSPTAAPPRRHTAAQPPRRHTAAQPPRRHTAAQAPHHGGEGGGKGVGDDGAAGGPGEDLDLAGRVGHHVAQRRVARLRAQRDDLAAEGACGRCVAVGGGSGAAAASCSGRSSSDAAGGRRPAQTRMRACAQHPARVTWSKRVAKRLREVRMAPLGPRLYCFMTCGVVAWAGAGQARPGRRVASAGSGGGSSASAPALLSSSTPQCVPSWPPAALFSISPSPHGLRLPPASTHAPLPPRQLTPRTPLTFL